ncbi:hypothetical protein [Streptomyces sp. NPDC001450]
MDYRQLPIGHGEFSINNGEFSIDHGEFPINDGEFPIVVDELHGVYATGREEPRQHSEVVFRRYQRR